MNNKNARTTSESDVDDATKNIFCNAPGMMSSAARRQVLKEMIKIMPESIQNRIRALKNLQLEQLKLESDFYEEVYKLERKYQEKYQPLFDKRKQIITGDVEPEKQEASWKSDDEEEILSVRMKDLSVKLKEDIETKFAEDVKGVPEFWLTIFRSSELLSEMVQEHDDPVLKKLRDIKIIYADNPMSYTLEFHFDQNEYFSNSVLTKQYFLKTTVDQDYPFSFEGPEIYKCTGCNINWEKGMNLTIKTIRKKQRHKARGAFRTITKQVPNDSFFNFFNPPEVPDDKNKIDSDSQSILTTDFEIGHFLRASIVPKAVLYYSGDIVDEDDDDDDFDEEEEEEEENENDSGEEYSDPEDSQTNVGGGGGGGGGGGKKPKPKKENAEVPNECQNQ